MNDTVEKMEITVERTIPAPVSAVFDSWLNPEVPGNPWNAAERVILDVTVDGLFYWTLKGTAHYGRFTEIKTGSRIQHTWVSPYTSGEESVVTITFVQQGEVTLMKLVHSELPNIEKAKAHEQGWNYFVGLFCEQFGEGTRASFNWDEAHSKGAVK